MSCEFTKLPVFSLRFALLACVGCLIWLGLPAYLQAAPITVPNFSFEATAPNDGNFDSEPIPGWVVTGDFSAAGAYNSTESQFSGSTGGPLPAPADGNNFGLANLSRTGSPGTDDAIFTSAASLATVEDHTLYTLTVAVGNRKGFQPDQVTIALLVDDVVVPESSFTFLGSTIANDSFADFTTSFTTDLMGDALTGGALKVQLTHSSLAGSGIATADFDNIRLDATELPPVPEPSAFCLLFLGTMGLVKLRRRQPAIQNRN